jgi:hypothetical protein
MKLAGGHFRMGCDTTQEFKLSGIQGVCCIIVKGNRTQCCHRSWVRCRPMAFCSNVTNSRKRRTDNSKIASPRQETCLSTGEGKESIVDGHRKKQQRATERSVFNQLLILTEYEPALKLSAGRKFHELSVGFRLRCGTAIHRREGYAIH